MAGGVKEKDLGWKRIKSALLGEPNSVRTGIQGPKSAEDHGGPTNVMVMSVHEFGAPSRGIPERAPMRTVFDKNRKKYQKRLTLLAHDLIAGKGKGKKGGSGKKKRAAGLSMIGEDYHGDIIDHVRSGDAKPELSPATQKKRGESGPPLWDTGQAMGALTTVLEKKTNPVKK